MIHHCDLCGSDQVREKLLEEKFLYGSGDERVTLSAMVPVFECETCGDAYTGEAAEISRHAAVCNYLGRLTPAEVKMLREGYGLTQDKFADVSGFGIASIKRWELGNQIQSESADNLLRLLRMPRNFLLVQEMNNAKPFEPKFKTTISERTFQQAKEFQLRRPAESNKAA
ncbi:type II TA system antitoxin MqsA family protein [Rhizobium gallicum]|nr:type II TA system antitoxin MqsA family protein [Rhizobium gallicum]TDW16233.1 putative zinc finger/helix-turn-helix YgiT family protein [Rhizobium azibense]